LLKRKGEIEMKKFLSIFVLMVFGISLSACTDSRETLVVGLEAAYAPFNWSTQTANAHTVRLDGQIGYADGYDVVVAKHIAEQLNMKLVIKAIEWDGLIPALQTNTIDVIIAGMSPTADRALTVNFSDIYYKSEQVMVVLKTSQYVNATSLVDFSGAKVVAQLGTLQDDLTDQIPNVNHLTPLESYGAITQAVRSGEADAFVAELPVAQSIIGTNSDLTFVQFDEENGFVVTDEQVSVSIAFRKSDTELLEQINEVLASITTEQRNQWMNDALARQN